jgi:hypothetical protein
MAEPALTTFATADILSADISADINQILGENFRAPTIDPSTNNVLQVAP